MSEVLRSQIKALIDISDDEFNYILSHFKPKKLKKHQFLLAEGEQVPYDFFVTKGLLKSYYQPPASDKEHILQFAWEHCWITDYHAHFNNALSTLYLNCIEDVEVLCLSLSNREKLCAEMHKIDQFFRKKSNAGYVALQRRILSLITKSAQEKYEQMIKDYPNLIQRVPKSYLASYLGVSRESLSRLTK